MNNIETAIAIFIPIAIILLGFLGGLILEKRLTKICHKISANPKLEPYTILLKSFQGIIVIWMTVAGIALALPLIKLPNTLNVLAEKILMSVFLISATLLVSRLAVSFIRIYSNRNESTIPLTSLFEYLTKVLIFTIGFLILIQSLGIKITALVAALGAGSLSIGLAFQGTLTNLISGVNIIVSGKIRPGDYIELKSGEEGYVVDVELKYTEIKNIFNNTIVIPNSQLINSSFKNYTLHEKEMLLPILVGVSYDSDLAQVEEITLSVAKKIMKTVEGGVPEYEPFLRYEKFEYFSINFTVYLQVQEYYDQLVVRHEFIKTLYQTYQLEGIKMPFPLKDSYLLEKS